jgi:cellulose synthase (UDP-forming)
MKNLKLYMWLIAFTPIALIIITTPMNDQKQYTFGLVSLLILFLLNFSKKSEISVAMVVLSTLTSTRYIYFRATQTLVFDSYIEAILGTILFITELYAWIMLLLGYFQTTAPLQRKIAPLPDDQSLWPTVDVYVPTYNEDLDVVRDTVLAAQCIDYPKDKVKVYLLDDGNRREFAVFAASAGVGYITRDNNRHAKAGNLNNAMTLTSGELICIFDCDHVATRIFLQATVGAFLEDPKLALIQTPHHFYSPDPFERNLYGGRDIPNEGELFYGPVQQGNDTWNATFFCGSCAVIRRSALNEIGGIATETVTEDAHTALKLQRLGWNSAYLPIRLSAGLATERLALHIIQRNRWARGMVQIFRVDNPLLGRGLRWHQRLCYLSAMMYFLFPVPRIVFLTAPLAYLLFDLSIIHSSASMIFAYALPHFIMCTHISSRMNGKHRYSFWGDVYDITLALHLALPTIITMFFPKQGKFNVTDKGELLDKSYFDINIVRPHIIVAMILFTGVAWGFWRLFNANSFHVEPTVLALNVGWATYSLFFLCAAIAVGRETRQLRKTIRLEVEIPAIIHYTNGISSRSSTIDLSMGGCLVKWPDDHHLRGEVEEIELQLHNGAIAIPVKKMMPKTDSCQLEFGELSLEQRREVVRIVLARADAWMRPERAADNPLKSLATIGTCMIEVIRSARRDRRVQKQAEQAQDVPNKEFA